MGKMFGRFEFVCVVQFLYFWHEIVHVWLSCSTGLAMFVSAKQVCENPRATVFHKDKATVHLC